MSTPNPSVHRASRIVRWCVPLVALLLAALLPPQHGAVAHAVPPLGSTRATTYPPAFCAYMEVRFGELWMHTVQEEVKRLMYAQWCRKNAPKPKQGDRKKP